MKKTIVFAMIISLLSVFCACGRNKNPGATETSKATETTKATEQDPTIIDPTILDPTFETNIPDPSVDTSMTDHTEDGTKDHAEDGMANHTQDSKNDTK